MTAVEVKLQRYDREPGGNHFYGPDIDALINTAVGGAEKLDRTQPHPSASIPKSSVLLELHEDGPLLQTVIEQIPALISACAALLTAWCAWKSSRKDIPPANRDMIRRTLRITVGTHTYQGQLSPKDLKRVTSMLASLKP